MTKYGYIIFLILFVSCSESQEPKENNSGDIQSSFDTAHSKSDYESVFSSTHCKYSNLSRQFDMQVEVQRYPSISAGNDSSVIKVFIKGKDSTATQDSLFISSLYYSGTFTGCDSVVSFATHINSNREFVDNYFGDIVVADLNFDNKDDIAIINDSGGNGGPLYSFFIQEEKGKFVLDRYLTDSVVIFPSKIDSVTQTLITRAPNGSCCVGERVFMLDKSKMSWQKIN